MSGNDEQIIRPYLRGDINSKDEDGNTALLRSLIAADPAATEALLGKGADINVVNTSGYTALIWALNLEYEDIAKDILKRPGISADMLNAVVSHSGYTALSIALGQGYQDIAKKILARDGISATMLNAVTERGDTVLTLALGKFYKDIAQDILKRPDISADMLNVVRLNVITDMDDTALSIAVQIGDDDLIKSVINALIDKNASINAIRTNGETEETLLHLAIRLGYIDIATKLIAAGADQVDHKPKVNQEIADLLAQYSKEIQEEIIEKEPTDPEDKKKFDKYQSPISLDLAFVDPVILYAGSVKKFYDRQEITSLLKKNGNGTNPNTGQSFTKRDLKEIDAETLNDIKAYIKKIGDELMMPSKPAVINKLKPS